MPVHTSLFLVLASLNVLAFVSFQLVTKPTTEGLGSVKGERQLRIFNLCCLARVSFSNKSFLSRDFPYTSILQGGGSSFDLSWLPLGVSLCLVGITLGICPAHLTLKLYKVTEDTK